MFSIDQQQLAHFEAFGFVVLRRLLFQGSAALLGGPTVPTVPVATCFTSNAGWHTDQGPDVGRVKFLIHLQPRTVADGALRVVPGSHDRSFGRRVRGYWFRDPGRQGFQEWPVPAVVLETSPGDVIAFDLHLFHSSTGRDKRLAWTIEYLRWPGLGDPDRLRAVRDLVVDAAEFDGEAFDKQRWPAWREWAAGARSIPSRRVAVERLRLLGVLGAEEQG